VRAPIKAKSSNRGQISSLMSFPAPVGGWNKRDSLAAMKPTDAVDLINWFPQTSYVEIRGGYVDHATGMAASGKTLSVYNAQDGSSEMFCAAAGFIYDVTSAGAVGAAVATPTNGKFQYVNFGDGTNQWLIMVNGVDSPQYYDGSAWVSVTGVSTPALTGITTSELVHVFVHKGRLMFIQKDSLSFWYLSAGVAGGALTEFSLAGVAQKGGYIMAGATWTIDAGDGPDDRAVFITSEGEVLVYAGTNPSSSTSWALVGVYEVGRPLGRRCLTKYGGDLLVITQNGVFPMAAAVQSASIDYKLALSFKIESAFNDAARSYGSNFGWVPVVYPGRSALIVNIPISEGGEHEQYVMNTITKSWCKFTEWDAEDFAIMNGQLYYVTGTKVVQAWSGTIDGVNDIIAYGKTAFNYFGSVGSQKKFRMFRPVLSVNGNISYLTDIDVDFQEGQVNGTASYSVTSGAQWDVTDWDEGLWAAGLEIVKQWTSPAEWNGYCASGKIKVATNSLTVQWMACDMMFERGNIL
jgi:hypothetical protein